MVHELKIEPDFFKDVLSGDKTFEIRENDRNFRIGDYLALNEIDDGVNWISDRREAWIDDRNVVRIDDPPKRSGPVRCSGRSVLARVTYVLTDDRFVRPGFAVLGIKLCDVYLGDENGKVDTSKIF